MQYICEIVIGTLLGKMTKKTWQGRIREWESWKGGEGDSEKDLKEHEDRFKFQKELKLERWADSIKVLKKIILFFIFMLLLFSCKVMSNSLQPLDCSTLGFPAFHYFPGFT